MNGIKRSSLHVVDCNESDRTQSNRYLALREISKRLDKQHNFKKGQLVRWKAGLQNRNYPGTTDLAIVRQVLETPVFDPSENTAGSPYFLETLTLVIGVFTEDSFAEYWVDGRRFEPCDLMCSDHS